MGLREDFEKWFSDGWRSPKAVDRSGDGYKLMQAQSAWITWQAASLAAAEKVKEEAAKLCDQIYDEYQEKESGCWPELRSDAQTGAGDCETAIRAIDVKKLLEQN